MYSEDDSKNAKVAATDYLLTSKVQVSEFGYYVEELHANNNKAFREQFYVSHGRAVVM